MLTEFNLADWKTEDKEWVKARKLQWKEIEKRWRVADPSFSGRKYLPIFRDFFLTGNLDLQSFYQSQGNTHHFDVAASEPDLCATALVYGCHAAL